MFMTKPLQRVARSFSRPPTRLYVNLQKLLIKTGPPVVVAGSAQ